jgi:BirA family biotin operon repressor/biotin-[acetyl-CoA-carboxylase] ligase
VRLGGRKIAGILVERALAPRAVESPGELAKSTTAGRGVVIGIGLNVNIEPEEFPDDLRAKATSLLIERGGEPVDRSDLCRDLIRRLDHWCEMSRTTGPQVLNRPWRSFSEHLGREVTVATLGGSITGRLVDIDLIQGLSLEIGTSHAGEIGATSDVRKVTLPPADILALEA